MSKEESVSKLKSAMEQIILFVEDIEKKNKSLQDLINDKDYQIDKLKNEITKLQNENGGLQSKFGKLKDLVK